MTLEYVLWSVGAFVGAVLINPFIEWGIHRYLMHRKLGGYGYRNHTLEHHAIFRAGESYHALTPEMEKNHGQFTWLEYLILPVIGSFFYVPLHFLIGLPVLAPALLAVLLNIMAFDFLHHHFHVARDCWFQRTRLFRFLHDHHRLHHAHYETNLNVTFPLADLCLGTLRLKPPICQAAPNGALVAVEAVCEASGSEVIDKSHSA